MNLTLTQLQTQLLDTSELHPERTTYTQALTYCTHHKITINQSLGLAKKDLIAFLRACTKNNDQYWFLYPHSRDSAQQYISAIRVALSRMKQKLVEEHGRTPQQFKLCTLCCAQTLSTPTGNPATLIGFIRTGRPEREVRAAIYDAVMEEVNASLAVNEEEFKEENKS